MRRTSSCRTLAAVASISLAALAGGCAGDGTGLDPFGNPLSPDVLELGPTLRSIQQNVFTPICTQCHTGAAAPLGLALDAGASWDQLVNVPSVERTDLLRVSPGDSDDSYLIWKLEGRAGITGGRMPLGQAPLSQAEIAAIRAWIEQGAQDD